ncbi:hypothetical protein [Echinicola soli]|uniref:hypothetical protein n=1 Tax=Echinicola soli TaxID=2591634 RepID=UPI00143D2FEB|nr:hypothetical protein [Echinicola soli]
MIRIILDRFGPSCPSLEGPWQPLMKNKGARTLLIRLKTNRRNISLFGETKTD